MVQIVIRHTYKAMLFPTILLKNSLRNQIHVASYFSPNNRLAGLICELLQIYLVPAMVVFHIIDLRKMCSPIRNIYHTCRFKITNLHHLLQWGKLIVKVHLQIQTSGSAEFVLMVRISHVQEMYLEMRVLQHNSREVVIDSQNRPLKF